MYCHYFMCINLILVLLIIIIIDSRGCSCSQPVQRDQRVLMKGPEPLICVNIAASGPVTRIQFPLAMATCSRGGCDSMSTSGQLDLQYEFNLFSGYQWDQHFVC